MGEVHAEIEGPVGTPYSGYFFELKLVLSGDFPNSPPRGFFLSKIYHPNVNPTSGDICVNTLKKVRVRGRWGGRGSDYMIRLYCLREREYTSSLRSNATRSASSMLVLVAKILLVVIYSSTFTSLTHPRFARPPHNPHRTGRPPPQSRTCCPSSAACSSCRFLNLA